jgi:hypothetical protein
VFDSIPVGTPPNYRLVFLDGRPHPPDIEPTWMGHSIGPWKVVFPLVLAPGENLMENICENNKFQELSAGQNR